jgi:hypothetical protein
MSNYNWGHQLFKNELGRQHDVFYYGRRFKKFNPDLSVKKLIDRSSRNFDLILTYEAKYSRFFKGLKNITNIPKVHIQVDYSDPTKGWAGFSTRDNVDKFLLNNKYDLFFATAVSNVEAMKIRLGTKKVFLLPFSVDINIYKKYDLNKIVDVMASYSYTSGVYPNRVKLRKNVKKMHRRGELIFFTTKVMHQNYVKYINQSRIFAHANNYNGRLNMKYFEVPACGTLFLTDKPEDFERLGFIDGKHMVLYEGMDDLRYKIKYYLKHVDERENIARQGMNFVRNKHSCEVRVKQFIDIVKRELGI